MECRICNQNNGKLYTLCSQNKTIILCKNCIENNIEIEILIHNFQCYSINIENIVQELLIKIERVKNAGK